MSSSSLASLASDSSFSTRASLSNKEKQPPDFDKCPRCRVQYDFLKRNTTTKVPLVLSCKHTICEDCIRRLCISNDAFCPVCKEKMEVPRNMIDSLPELFTPHYSLIGYLMWTKNSPKKHFGNWVATGVTLKDKQGGYNDLDPSEIDGEVSDLSLDFEPEKFYETLEFEKCPEHKDNFKNIHCIVCQDVYCCYCFLIRHKGHDAEYLWELVPDETVDLDKLKNYTEIVLKHLFNSYKKIKQLKILDVPNFEKHIKKRFVDLHAQLYVAEKNIKKDLQNWQPTSEIDFKDLSDSVKLGINKAIQLLSYFEAPNNQQINIRQLCQEAEEIKQLPCRLVTDQDVLDPVKFVCGSLGNIEENFSLNQIGSPEYDLYPIEDWTTEETFPNKITNHEVFSGTKANKPEFKPEALVTTTGVKRKEQLQRRKSSEGGEVRIVLTHLNDLNSFFVRRHSNQEIVENMNYNIGKREKRKLTVNDIRVGRTYGVLYEISKGRFWRRAKLMEVINKESSVQCKMFYIDYGNTQLVAVDRLKELDLPFVKRSPYAFECKLTNPDNVFFEENAHLQLISIIDEKELYIQFKKKKNRTAVQEVDLLLPTSQGTLLSVRDIILKNVPKLEKNALCLSGESKLFPNSQRFQVGQEEDVIISYIKDPFEIYVQMVKNYHFIQKMKLDLNEYYKNQTNTLFIPIEGSDAVVKYEHPDHGEWHRCKITSVNNNNTQATVFFVDWGGSATVSWANIQSLTQAYTKMESQNIAIRLAHIQRPNNEPWKQEAIDFLNEQVKYEKTCKIVVSNANPLEVALFQYRPSANICLNSLLVENGFAISVGNISETLYWPNKEDIDACDDDEDLAFQMIKKSQEIILEYSDSEIPLGTMKQQVHILHYESPDLIYIKLAKFKESDEEMHKELQIHYSKMRSLKESWKKQQYCVIYDTEKNNYFRGIIRKSVGSDSFMVYLYDHAREVKVNKKSIFKLDPYFKRFVCQVWKCRLMNIKPVGDGKSWSKIVDEILLKIFANYKTIYINKVASNVQEKSIGVVMWYLMTTPTKALEPSKQHFVSINQSLIESGVAFSDKSLPKCIFIPNGDNNAASFSSSQISEKMNDIREKTNKDWYEIICEDEAIHECPLKRWPSSLILEKKEFVAHLICIDSEGWFSVRDEELNEYYQTLEKNLNETLHFLRSLQEEEEDWKPNEMCTMLYEDKLYRSTILEVLSRDEISVEMIDFGSEHKVSRKDLSRHLMYPEVAPLLYKVQLYNVISKYGQLQSSDVEELLSIVSDEVTVVVKSELNCDTPLAEIYLENGLSVNDLIIEKCPHLIRLEIEATTSNLVDSSAEKTDDDYNTVDSDTDKDKDDIDNFHYIYAQLPETNGKHKMTIVNILKDKDQFRAVLSTVGNEVRLVDKEFITLTSNMQNLVDEQPKLKDIELHKPCVCPHNDLWCRALIYDVEGIQHGYVLVLFVDYGTINMVNIENIKVMRPEWFDIPVYNLVATVNIKLKKKTMSEMVLMQLSNLRGKSVSVEIITNDPLKIHLYDGESFYYQHFVDCNVVTAL